MQMHGHGGSPMAPPSNLPPTASAFPCGAPAAGQMHWSSMPAKVPHQMQQSFRQQPPTAGESFRQQPPTAGASTSVPTGNSAPSRSVAEAIRRPVNVEELASKRQQELWRRRGSADEVPPSGTPPPPVPHMGMSPEAMVQATAAAAETAVRQQARRKSEELRSHAVSGGSGPRGFSALSPAQQIASPVATGERRTLEQEVQQAMANEPRLAERLSQLALANPLSSAAARSEDRSAPGSGRPVSKSSSQGPQRFHGSPPQHEQQSVARRNIHKEEPGGLSSPTFMSGANVSTGSSNGTHRSKNVNARQDLDGSPQRRSREIGTAPVNPVVASSAPGQQPSSPAPKQRQQQPQQQQTQQQQQPPTQGYRQQAPLAAQQPGPVPTLETTRQGPYGGIGPGAQELFPQPSSAARTQASERIRLEEENKYLVRNIEKFKGDKRRLENQVRNLEDEFRGLKEQKEQQESQYKSLYEQMRRQNESRGGGAMEIQSLQDQLWAVTLLKDAMFEESSELRRRLKEAESKAAASNESEKATCVVCMDNLCNLVCFPCKHLAMCTYCGTDASVRDCPICRQPIEEKVQIYTA